MFTRKVALNGAISVNGDQYCEGVEAVHVSLGRRLAERWSENFMNRNSGTQIKQVLLNVAATRQAQEQEIRRRILSHPRVIEIAKLTITQDQHDTITVTATVISDLGIIELNQGLGNG